MTSRERVTGRIRPLGPGPHADVRVRAAPPVAESVLGRPFVEYLAGMEPWLEMARETGFERALRALRGGEGGDRRPPGARHDLRQPQPRARRSVHVRSALASSAPGSRWHAEGDPVERLAGAQPARVRDHDGRAAGGFAPGLRVPPRRRWRSGTWTFPSWHPPYFHGIWTDSDLMQVMLIEPEVAREHFRLATRRSLAVIADYARIGIEMIGNRRGLRRHAAPHFSRELPRRSSCPRSGYARMRCARPAPGR